MRRRTVLSNVLFYSCMSTLVLVIATMGQWSETATLSLIAVTALTAVGAFSALWMQENMFRSTFRFDGAPAREELQADAQKIVGETIEKARLTVNEYFQTDEVFAKRRRGLEAEKQEILAPQTHDPDSFKLKQEKLVAWDKNWNAFLSEHASHGFAKENAKKRFWRRCTIARWWGYNVPRSIKEPAPLETVTA